MKKLAKILYLMRYYLLSILIFTLLIIAINTFLFLNHLESSWWQISLFTFFSVFMVIVIDGITAFLIHKMPKKIFNPNLKIYKVGSFEKKFYKFIKIRKWKDKIPEIGALTCDFGKGKIENPNDPLYIYEFLIEMGYAEAIHFISCISGFLIIFIIPFKYALFIGMPVAIINIFYNILSALIQRYNRPKLLALYERKTRNNLKNA